jgi:dipeptidyl aminopeptidase/acylaminoacyl peptidase
VSRPAAQLKIVAAILTLLGAASAAAAPMAIEVSDAIQTTFVVPEKSIAAADRPSPVSISPDGRRFALRLARGDIARNGISLDVLTGTLDSLDAAAGLTKAASLFTHGWGSETSPYHPALNSFARPVWVNDRTIAFQWDGEGDILQFVAVDLEARQTRWLTRHPTDVLLAVANRQGDVFYAAQAARPDDRAARLARGFIVGNGDAISAMRGDAIGTLDLYYDLDLFLTHGQSPPRKLDLRLRWVVGAQPSLSPDGRSLLVSAWPARLPEAWRGRYAPEFAPARLDIIGEAFKDRDSWYGRQISQLFVVDMKDGGVRALWNAPTRDALRLVSAWSPDGRRIALGPTYLPPESRDPAAAAGTRLPVVDSRTGAYSSLPLPESVDPLKVSALGFAGNDSLWVEAAGRRLRFLRDGDGWRYASEEAAAPASSSPVKVELRQGPNQPPTLYAVEAAGGRERMILDPNPGLAERFALGRVEHVHFPDRAGRSWSALLYHPVGEVRGRRYPLVIQTHGHAPANSFSLYGMGLTAPGLGPSWSIYAAQPLAGRGIAVLQLEDKRIAGISQTPAEPEMYMHAYEAAVDCLDRDGLVDRARVGLSGFSRSGWHVEYALTHSDFTFAAAITSDNLGGSYLEDSLDPGNLASENGGEPYGAGLESWLETAPGFNAERVRTPLRAQVESRGAGGILSKWELFARLRFLGAPVEMAVVPSVDRGSHNLLNPGQVLAVKQGAVDWYDFWLNRREDQDPAKAGQYARWRILRAKRDEMLKRPRPPLLDWTAKARGPEAAPD